ncbi:DUF559 domain-containing protein [Aquimarina algicola]|uniref:DUF559 domain-containing protein n=1 Tax=Aquimarina algicola TaxID=2589995 RepID=A0A504JBV6_9FLAO|nr:DUF559 domain-containing protein [Aquimarina algicola]TPN85965.1 DUF559 domain-containing protein [Aquimarina algicola]
MTSPTIPIHQRVSEKVIRYSLDNAQFAKDTLYQELIKKEFYFTRNESIMNYNFDFYAPKLKIAIQVDTYAHEFLDHHNIDATKKLFIASLGITVFRFTDYQILTDIEEIIRILKNQIKTTTPNYVI